MRGLKSFVFSRQGARHCILLDVIVVIAGQNQDSFAFIFQDLAPCPDTLWLPGYHAV